MATKTKNKNTNTINLDKVRSKQQEKIEENELLNSAVNSFEEMIIRYINYGLTDNGKRYVKRWLKKYSYDELQEALEIAIDRYFINCTEYNKAECLNRAFNMIQRIAENKRRVAKNPVLKEVYYLRKILINRLPYINQWEARAMIENLLNNYPDLYEDIKNFCCQCDNWAEFKDFYIELMSNL